ncbi:MAG: LysE family translocator [Proteobacteria bacterium]|nr:LysE family translocator [Pseudomonadota bacterium]
MSFQVWLAFAAATSVILVIPGPTILLVISYALGHGRRSAYATVAGVALGDFTAMTTAMFGLGALLATSAALFTVLKWIGAAYLIYLGINLWRAPANVAATGAADGETKPSRIFLHAYVVTALNPKSIVFFVAFLPQFLDMAGVTLANMAIFEATFVVLATLNALSYALVASAARRTIRKPKVQRAVNRVGGSLLIGAGLLAVGWKRAAT